MAEGPEGCGGIWIGKTAQQQLETRVMTSTGQQRQVHDDLVFGTRTWRDASTPPQRSIIQVVFDANSGVQARLNGQVGKHLGSMEAPVAAESAQTLRVGYAPGAEEETFQGWVDAIRVYEGVPSKAWLEMSSVAEQQQGQLLRRGPVEEAPAEA